MAVDPAAIRRGTVVVVRLAGGKARPAVVRCGLLSERAYATVLLSTSEVKHGISLRADLAPTGHCTRHRLRRVLITRVANTMRA